MREDENKSDKHHNNDAINGQKYKEDLERLFPSIYLTMLSMIQGVVFGFLLYNLYLNNLYPNFRQFPDYKIQQYITFGIFFLISLFTLILIWYDYLYNIVLRRCPNFKDAIFPFLFGIFQVGMAFNLTKPPVCMIFAIGVGFVGCLAYHNTRIAYLKFIKYKEEIYGIKVEEITIKYIVHLQVKKIRILWIMMFIIFLFFISYHLAFDGNPFEDIMIVIYGFMFILLSYFLLLSFFVTERFFQDIEKIKEGVDIDKLNTKVATDLFNVEAFINKLTDIKYNKIEKKSWYGI